MTSTRKRRIAGAALLGGVAIVCLAGWAFLSGDPDAAQDDCAFGGVSNARYRAILAEARLLVEDERPAWIFHVTSRNIDEGTDLLHRQYQSLSAGLTTIPERIAAMHALARAHGAGFARPDPDTARPWSATPATAREEIVFVYGLNTSRIGHWQPLRRWTTISGKFAVRDVGPGFGIGRGVEGGSLLMFVTGSGLTPQIAPPRRSAFHNCPPIPGEAWLAAYAAPAEATPAFEPGETNVDLLVQLADGLLARGRVRLALRHLERALSVADRTLSADNETTIGVLDRLARAYRTVGQPQRGAAASGRALDSRIRLGLPPRMVQ